MNDEELRAAIPALNTGGAAVITGGASGIGLACARRFADLGLPLVLADHNAAGLAAAAAVLPDATTVTVDVGRPEDIERMKDTAFARGPVAILVNNAGTGIPGSTTAGAEDWRRVMDVNFFSMVHAVAGFAPPMMAQGTPGLIINTGSKQGITTPPGNPSYNVSKAAIKAYTEALAHELRNTPDCRLTVHLLIPGFTFTGMAMARLCEKPPSAWTAEQVADFMLDAIARGDFYILCPDNETPRELDEKRMQWAMDDIIENRPPLSRWHPDYEDAFEAFLES